MRRTHKTNRSTRRMKHRIPREKLLIIAETIFNSSKRYGISLYLNPIFDKEDLKVKKLSKTASDLQTLQNEMLRIILNLDKSKHINMQIVRENVKMMSINQMSIYHTILEANNVIRNSSSDHIKIKWSKKNEHDYSLRRNEYYQKIPNKTKSKCNRFSFYGKIIQQATL